MARLIDAETLKAKYAWWANGGSDAKEWKDVFDFMIDHTPTVEVDPRVHAKWLDKNVTVEVQELLACRHDDRVFECSHCGNLEMTRSNYCRRCGARMDEVENG